MEAASKDVINSVSQALFTVKPVTPELGKKKKIVFFQRSFRASSTLDSFHSEGKRSVRSALPSVHLLDKILWITLR